MDWDPVVTKIGQVEVTIYGLNDPLRGDLIQQQNGSACHIVLFFHLFEQFLDPLEGHDCKMQLAVVIEHNLNVDISANVRYSIRFIESHFVVFRSTNPSQFLRDFVKLHWRLVVETV